MEIRTKPSTIIENLKTKMLYRNKEDLVLAWVVPELIFSEYLLQRAIKIDPNNIHEYSHQETGTSIATAPPNTRSKKPNEIQTMSAKTNDFKNNE